MGLLDTLLGAPGSDQSQAMGLLAAGLMRGDFAGGLLGANQMFSPEAKMKREFMQAQIDETRAQAQERAAALEQRRKLAEWGERLFGNAQRPQVSQGQLGSGTFGIMPTQGGAPDIPQNLQPRGIGGLDLNELAAYKVAGGADLLPYFKTANEGFKRDAGSFYEYPGGRREYIPRVPEGATYSNGRISGIPGHSDFVTQQTLATEAPKTLLSSAAQINLRKNPDGTESPVSSLSENPTLQNVLGGIFGQRQGAPAVPAPATGGRGPRVPVDDTARNGILQQELTAAQLRLAQIQADPRATPDMIRRAQEDVNGVTAELKRGGVGYGKTTAQEQKEKLVLGASEKVNESFIKSSYEPTLAAGASARELADTVEVTRQTIRNLGSTGWSTQARASAASILSGLGIAPKSAQMFAANAELFQKTAMDRLWTTLNEAKGPQTEGDAARASKTYASLANRPEANEFILDFAQAKAQRDMMKSKFYQQALPVAQKKGDLAEVDREWSARMPSIFSMPTMQRWGGGIK